jgi:hypothetical protein
MEIFAEHQNRCHSRGSGSFLIETAHSAAESEKKKMTDDL